MAHAYTCNRQHLVFSTLERRDLIGEDLQPRLWSYMAGVAKNRGLQAMAIGGIANHVHLLVSLPSDWSNAKAVQVIKANSSRWMREQGVRGFAWQRGHAGFSVSVSATAAVVRYIQTKRNITGNGVLRTSSGCCCGNMESRSEMKRCSRECRRLKPTRIPLMPAYPALPCGATF